MLSYKILSGYAAVNDWYVIILRKPQISFSHIQWSTEKFADVLEIFQWRRQNWNNDLLVSPFYSINQCLFALQFLPCSWGILPIYSGQSKQREAVQVLVSSYPPSPHQVTKVKWLYLPMSTLVSIHVPIFIYLTHSLLPSWLLRLQTVLLMASLAVICGIV